MEIQLVVYIWVRFAIVPAGKDGDTLSGAVVGEGQLTGASLAATLREALSKASPNSNKNVNCDRFGRAGIPF